MRRVEGDKGKESVVEKAAGNERVFIPGRGLGWQMRPGQMPYRTRRGVESGRGSAKLDPVIHRYPSKPLDSAVVLRKSVSGQGSPITRGLLALRKQKYGCRLVSSLR